MVAVVEVLVVVVVVVLLLLLLLLLLQAASPCLVVRRVGRELALALQEVEEIQEEGFGDREQYVRPNTTWNTQTTGNCHSSNHWRRIFRNISS